MIALDRPGMNVNAKTRGLKRISIRAEKKNKHRVKSAEKLRPAGVITSRRWQTGRPRAHLAWKTKGYQKALNFLAVLKRTRCGDGNTHKHHYFYVACRRGTYPGWGRAKVSETGPLRAARLPLALQPHRVSLETRSSREDATVSVLVSVFYYYDFYFKCVHVPSTSFPQI